MPAPTESEPLLPERFPQQLWQHAQGVETRPPQQLAAAQRSHHTQIMAACTATFTTHDTIHDLEHQVRHKKPLKRRGLSKF